MRNVSPLLVARTLVEGGRAHLEAQGERVALRTSVQVALAGKQVQPEEAVVPPALTHLYTNTQY